MLPDDDPTDIAVESRWLRRPSDAWTLRPFRNVALPIIRATARGRLLHWKITELFTDTVHERNGLGVTSIDVWISRKPPVQPPEKSFRQRKGTPLLIWSVPTAEVALSFPDGPDTPSSEIVRLLEFGEASLLAR